MSAAELHLALTCQLSPSGLVVRKGNRTIKFSWFNLLLLEPERSRAQGRDVPKDTQLVHGGAGELGFRTPELKLLLTHQLPAWPDLSLVPRKLPKRALEVVAKTNFATGQHPPTPNRAPCPFLPAGSAFCSAQQAWGRAIATLSASDCAEQGSPTPRGPRRKQKPRPSPAPAEDTPRTRPLPSRRQFAGPAPGRCRSVAPLPARSGSAHTASPTPHRPAPPGALLGVWLHPFPRPLPRPLPRLAAAAQSTPPAPPPRGWGPPPGPPRSSVLRAPPAPRPGIQPDSPPGGAPRSRPAGRETPLSAA